MSTGENIFTVKRDCEFNGTFYTNLEKTTLHIGNADVMIEMAKGRHEIKESVKENRDGTLTYTEIPGSDKPLSALFNHFEPTSISPDIKPAVDAFIAGKSADEAAKLLKKETAASDEAGPPKNKGGRPKKNKD